MWVAGALLLALAACDGDEPVAQATDTPTATEHCGPAETVPIQGEGHLVGDQEPPIPYNSTPPTSGWHTSTDVPIVTAPDDQPLREPEQVTVLEQGGIVVTHNGLPTEEYEQLERTVTDRYAGQVALTPYEQLGDGEVAMTAWGVLQRCDAVDLEALETFVEAYAQRGAS